MVMGIKKLLLAGTFLLLSGCANQVADIEDSATHTPVGFTSLEGGKLTFISPNKGEFSVTACARYKNIKYVWRCESVVFDAVDISQAGSNLLFENFKLHHYNENKVVIDFSFNIVTVRYLSEPFNLYLPVGASFSDEFNPFNPFNANSGEIETENAYFRYEVYE